jgi:hypothetical protein
MFIAICRHLLFLIGNSPAIHMYMPVTVLNAQRLDSRTLKLVIIIPKPTKAVNITVRSVRS